MAQEAQQQNQQQADPYATALIQSVTRQRDEWANRAAEFEAKATVYRDLSHKLRSTVESLQARIAELDGSAAKAVADAKDTHPMGDAPSTATRARKKSR